MSIHAIIPAAGCGVRFGSSTKKQFLTLAGKTILMRTIDAFLESGIFSQIVVVLSADEIEKTLLPKEVKVVEGGKSRAESVCRGFGFLHATNEDIVLIHDAVRPMVSVDLIKKVAGKTAEHHAVIPGIVLSDTIKHIVDSKVQKTIDRDQHMAIQTPQGFRAEILQKAYKEAQASFDWTDEAMLVERGGVIVTVVEGEKNNIKVTTPFDLKLAEALICE